MSSAVSARFAAFIVDKNMRSTASQETKIVQADMRRKMSGHGILMILCTLLFGVGLWMNLLGGFELYPGKLINFNVPVLKDGLRRVIQTGKKP